MTWKQHFRQVWWWHILVPLLTILVVGGLFYGGISLEAKFIGQRYPLAEHKYHTE